MAIPFRELGRQIEELAPPQYAEPWDNVGLQVGSPDAQIGTVLVAVDATRQVVEEAVRKKAEALVVHHPLLFGPVSSVRSDRWPGCVVAALIERGCGLYVAHTNLDAAPRTNSSYALAQRLGLGGLRPLAPQMPDDLVALTVQVGRGARERLVAELVRQGCEVRNAGRSGGPDDSDGSTLDVICSRERAAQTLDGLGRSPDLPVQVLEARPLLGRPPLPALGVIGECKSMAVPDLVSAVRSALEVPAVRASSMPDARIAKVAVVAGSAKGLTGSAAASGAEALIAGEIGYHPALEASQNGMATIEVGHFSSERPAMANLAALLREAFGAGLDVLISTAERDPFAER